MPKAPVSFWGMPSWGGSGQGGGKAWSCFSGRNPPAELGSVSCTALLARVLSTATLWPLCRARCQDSQVCEQVTWVLCHTSPRLSLSVKRAPMIYSIYVLTEKLFYFCFRIMNAHWEDPKREAGYRFPKLSLCAVNSRILSLMPTDSLPLMWVPVIYPFGVFSLTLGQWLSGFQKTALLECKHFL